MKSNIQCEKHKKSLFVENATVTVIASRRSGKTTLIKHLLKNDILRYHAFVKKYMFTTIPNADGEYKGIFEQNEIIDFELISGILPRIVKKNETEKLKMLIVIEDPDTDKAQHIINKLYTMSRHVNIFLILISQMARRICSPTVRANSDYVIMKNISNSDILTLHEIVRVCDIKKAEDLQQIHANTMSKAGEKPNYKFLFIDNVSGKYCYIVA